MAVLRYGTPSVPRTLVRRIVCSPYCGTQHTLPPPLDKGATLAPERLVLFCPHNPFIVYIDAHEMTAGTPLQNALQIYMGLWI